MENSKLNIIILLYSFVLSHNNKFVLSKFAAVAVESMALTSIDANQKIGTNVKEGRIHAPTREVE